MGDRPSMKIWGRWSCSKIYLRMHCSLLKKEYHQLLSLFGDLEIVYLNYDGFVSLRTRRYFVPQQVEEMILVHQWTAIPRRFLGDDRHFTIDEGRPSQ